MRWHQRVRRRNFLVVLGATGNLLSAARAQQKAMSVVGYLSRTAPGPAAPFVAAYRQGLAETGYVEMKDVVIEYRWAENRPDRLPALATELVNRSVDIIVTGGGPAAAVAAQRATSKIRLWCKRSGWVGYAGVPNRERSEYGQAGEP